MSGGAVKAGVIMVLLWVFVIAAGLVGWVANLVQIIQQWPSGWDAVTPMIAMKLIGIIVPPLGAVMGWVGFFV